MLHNPCFIYLLLISPHDLIEIQSIHPHTGGSLLEVGRGHTATESYGTYSGSCAYGSRVFQVRSE